MKIPSLDEINRETGRHAFDLEGFAWGRGVDDGKNWCPEQLTHLFYCPSYDLLEPDEKRYYNQLFAMGVCEQFLLLEDILLVRGMRRIIDAAGKRLSPDLRIGMENLIIEEKKHGEMFRRLLRTSAPDLYRDRDLVIYDMSRRDSMMVDFFLWGTPVFVSWVFVAMIFEEKSIDFYRKYLAAESSEDLDPLYREVHRKHAQEEVRHVQIDHYLVDLFWDQAPAWKKRLNHWIFYFIMTKFARPERTVRRMLDLLVTRFPRLQAINERLVGEAMAVAGDPEWQRASYSPIAQPRTFAIFERYPDFQLLERIFPQYRQPAPVPLKADSSRRMQRRRAAHIRL